MTESPYYVENIFSQIPTSTKHAIGNTKMVCR